VKALLAAALILMFCLSACGSSAALRESMDDERETPVTGSIDPFDDPPGYEGDPFADFELVTGMSVPDFSTVQYEEEILTGAHFTVQISAATTEDTAERLVEIVSLVTTLPVFIDHLDGYWKVRVGAFPSRGEAEAHVEALVDMGYPGAWVTSRQP